MAEPAYELPSSSEREDPFYWGSRHVRVTDASGRTTVREVSS
jgi:hypothetical protein